MLHFVAEWRKRKMKNAVSHMYGARTIEMDFYSFFFPLSAINQREHDFK